MDVLVTMGTSSYHLSSGGNTKFKIVVVLSSICLDEYFLVAYFLDICGTILYSIGYNISTVGLLSLITDHSVKFDQVSIDLGVVKEG